VDVEQAAAVAATTARGAGVRRCERGAAAGEETLPVAARTRGLFSAAARRRRMDRSDVEARIEDGIEDADATVTRARGDPRGRQRRPRDDEVDETDLADDDHLEATVVSPAFEGESLVAQHELVYDALGDAMTTDIHALELTTRTPAEADERSE
jgi:stress-induced morphogen